MDLSTVTLSLGGIDPAAGLPVLPGKRGPAGEPGQRTGGAGEAGEGVERSADSSHHQRDRTQRFSAKTYR